MESERFKLVLGDCIEKMRELPDDSIDMIFTDPPYGHNNNDGDFIHIHEKALGEKTVTLHALDGSEVPACEAHPARPILNDSPEAATSVFRAFLVEAARVLVKGGGCCCCCCGGGGPDPQFARWSMWMDELIPFKMAVVWDKGGRGKGLGLGWHYHRDYELVLVAAKGAPCKWYDETHAVSNVVRHIKRVIPSAAQHPTEKPVALAEHFIHLHTREGEVVLDPFMGSGSTGEAALRAGRRFVGMELDPHWFEYAGKRLAGVATLKRLGVDEDGF